jgi:glycosyltransferase involved in cell wall biosynthesis
MKILHITKKFPKAVGGDAKVVYNLKALQEEAGHEVSVLTPNCPEIEGYVYKFGLKEKAENLDRITLRRILSLIFLLALGFQRLRKVKPDIVHSHSADLGFFISIPARLCKIPVINTCHSLSFPYRKHFLKGFAEKFFLRYAGFKKIITPDPSSLDSLTKAGFRPAYIPNGINIKSPIRKIEKEKFRFLYTGRLEKEKGLRYLIEAAASIKSKADFSLLFAGSGSYKEELEDLARKLEVNADFVGYKEGEELEELYRGSGALVLPSMQEGFPISILEAWAAGLPVIATKVGGIPRICTHEENSLLVEPKNSRELAEAMLRIINDKNLGEKLGNNGRKLVEEKYSLEEVSKATLELYREVAGK